MPEPDSLTTKGPLTILLVDDDDEDRALIKKALERAHVINGIREVADGQEMLDYLRREGVYTNPAQAPKPGLILLDLNMPGKDGRDALREMRADPDFRGIPIIVFSVSEDDVDIANSYDQGVSAYVSKPSSPEEFMRAIRLLEGFWFEIVRLPVR